MYPILTIEWRWIEPTILFQISLSDLDWMSYAFGISQFSQLAKQQRHAIWLKYIYIFLYNYIWYIYICIYLPFFPEGKQQQMVHFRKIPEYWTFFCLEQPSHCIASAISPFKSFHFTPFNPFFGEWKAVVTPSAKKRVRFLWFVSGKKSNR